MAKRRNRRSSARRARRRNPGTAVTVLGVLLGLGVLGTVVYAMRSPRRSADFVGMGPAVGGWNWLTGYISNPGRRRKN